MYRSRYFNTHASTMYVLVLEGCKACGIVNGEYIEMEGGKEGRSDDSEFKGLKLEPRSFKD